MVFSSLEFLLWFLPFFLATYYISPKKSKNFILAFFSLVFYAYGCLKNPLYFLLIILSIFINYLLGIFISKGKGKGLFLSIGLILDFGALFVFKYLDFLLDSINKVTNYFDFLPSTSLELTRLALPIGISFYTFQIVSYLIDVYRGNAKAEKNLINLTAYISAFPQLIAGPIVKYNDISSKLKDRCVNKAMIIEGAEKFIFGLGFKVILANRLSGVWNEAVKIGFADLSQKMAVISIIGYSLQLYFDFYGYSLMAIGLGKMMGFDFPVNFREPYMAVSMTDFWRRWHMTLGSWFKEYVYIPLGGNRKGKLRTYLNLFIVWLLTGIWHGAGVNFLLWGLFLAVIIIIEKLFLGKFLEKFRLIGHIYMIFLIPLSWLLFEAGSLGDIKDFILCLLNRGGEFVYSDDWRACLEKFWPYLLSGLAFSTPAFRYLYEKVKGRWYCLPVLIIILAFSIYNIYMGLDDPFMYFRF